MKDALLGAQKQGHKVVAEAQEKADEIIAQAESKANELIEEATLRMKPPWKRTGRKLRKKSRIFMRRRDRLPNSRKRSLICINHILK